MLKFYAGIGLLLLLGFALCYLHKQSYQAGINAERSRWQDEVIRLRKESDEYKFKAENQIIEERVVWRDRIRTIEKISDDCIASVDILRVLHESGIYTGPIQ